MGGSNRHGGVIKSCLIQADRTMTSGTELNATVDHMHAMLNDCNNRSPFLLQNEGEYQAWRQRKLSNRQTLSASEVFKLDSNGLLPESSLNAVRHQIEAFNFATFESAETLDKNAFLLLNEQFGLYRIDANPGADEDRVTSLRVVKPSDARSQYIPYTNRALNWHTDGYYNSFDRRIEAFALYCVNQAGRGGGNYLFDHEWMYLLIRDQSPDLLDALMSPDMMRIPANVQGRDVIRPEESGPVFSLQPDSCALNMRYTSRPRNIVWKSDKRSERALNLIREILMDGDAVVDIRLQNRQGLVCNNVLHGRQAFHDDAQRPARLIYRARYYDAIDIQQD